MTHIRLEVNGNIGSISVHAFKLALDNWWTVLKDLDIAISGKANGSLDWMVTNLSIGSVILDAQAVNIYPDKNVASEVVQASIRGMEALERKGSSPPYLGPRGIASVKKLVNMIGKDGVTGFKVSNAREKVNITTQSTVNMKELLKEKYLTYGSIEGKMEGLNIHKYSRFIIYVFRTNKAVECRFDKESQMEEVRALIGKRVSVFGVIHYNVKGEPMKVEAERLRRLRDGNELPTIEEMSGCAPTLLDGLSVEEYLTEIRVG